MSFTRLKFETKRCGVARKSVGSVTRRIASEMVLWKEGVCEEGRDRWLKQGLRSGGTMQTHLLKLTQHSLWLWPFQYSQSSAG